VEEDRVDGDVVVGEVRDEALRRVIELGGDDDELVRLVDGLGRRARESLSEGCGEGARGGAYFLE
jgi:hypothetical protein